MIGLVFDYFGLLGLNRIEFCVSPHEIEGPLRMRIYLFKANKTFYYIVKEM